MELLDGCDFAAFFGVLRNVLRWGPHGFWTEVMGSLVMPESDDKDGVLIEETTSDNGCIESKELSMTFSLICFLFFVLFFFAFH